MKKLTAGIFTTLLTVVAVGSANANIASQGYVDTEVAKKVTIDQGIGNANKAVITDVSGNVVTGAITNAMITDGTIEKEKLSSTVQASLDKAESAPTAADVYTKIEADTKFQTQDNLATADTVTTTDKGSTSKYPSVAAAEAIANAAVDGVTTDLTDLTRRVGQAETDITALETDKLDAQTYTTEVGTVSAENMGTTANTVVGAIKEITTNYATKTGIQADLDAKQDKNMGIEAANKVLTTDVSGNITASDSIASTQVSGLGDLATADTVSTGLIEDSAVTEGKLSTDVSTKINNAIPQPDAGTVAENRTYVLTWDSTNGYAWETIER